jgi:hypothetical protein
MKKASKKRQTLRALFLALTGMVCGAQCSHAAEKSYDIDLKEIRQAPYDINLKELRQSPSQRTKTSRRKHAPKTALPAAPTTNIAPKDSSLYTVQPGDFPFLILIRHYGLSHAAAEQMVPQVMRLNNLRDPRKLTVGQRLIIPVVPAVQTPPKDNVSNTPPPASAPSRVVQPPTVLPAAPPVVSQSAAQVPSAQPPATKTAPVREIQLHSAPPCQLVLEAAKLLGLRISDVIALIQTENVSMAYKDQKLVVACGLTAAETYTSQRLLARHGAQLLLFNGDETPREVIEELADSLGISFQPANQDAGNELPATYIFSAADSSGHDVRLTILPAPAAKEKVSP